MVLECVNISDVILIWNAAHSDQEKAACPRQGLIKHTAETANWSISPVLFQHLQFTSFTQRAVESPHSYRSSPASRPLLGHVGTPTTQDTHVFIIIHKVLSGFAEIGCLDFCFRHKWDICHGQNVFYETDFYHLRPCWHFNSKHIQASAAAAVLALLIVHMNSHSLVGL